MRFFLPPPFSWTFSLYIHSVFMPADNKERASIHAGGGVTGNSWQLFKYLLSVSSFSLHLDFGLDWKEEKAEEVVVWLWGLISLPTSISNSLCSPHASRRSALKLPTTNAAHFKCCATQLNVQSALRKDQAAAPRSRV